MAITINNVNGNAQIIEKVEGNVVQNNGISVDDTIRLIAAIKDVLSKHSAGEHTQELEQIISEAEAELADPKADKQNVINTLSGKVQGWIDSGHKLAGVAASAQSLYSTVGGLLASFGAA
ncbi:hypothetical protein [Endozoicomonas sp. ALB115]|uniref:hypothetical protein n=1 Tax=Endozoicomonas sp. ALB115 TaxID=3403074 RepID=UPI003BB57820